MKHLLGVISLILCLCWSNNDGYAQFKRLPESVRKNLNEVQKQSSASPASASRMRQVDPFHYGTTPELKGLDHFGGSGDNSIQATGMDVQGNSYILGEFAGEMELKGQSLTTDMYKAMYLAKFDLSGELVWLKKLTEIAGGIRAETRAKSLLVTETGEIYATGTYKGGDLTLGNLTLEGMPYLHQFVVHLDADGTFQWVQDASFSLGQETMNPLAIDSTYLYVLSDHLVYYFDKDTGEEIRGEVLSPYCHFDDIEVHQGDVYVAGHTDNFYGKEVDFEGDTIVQGTYDGEALLAAFDSNMQLKWVKKASHENADYSSNGKAMLIKDSVLYLAGFSEAWIDLNDGNDYTNVSGNFVAAYDLNGVATDLLDVEVYGDARAFYERNSEYVLETSAEVATLNLETAEVSSSVSLEDWVQSITYSDLGVLMAGRKTNNTFLSFSDELSSTSSWTIEATSDYGTARVAGMDSDSDNNLYVFGSFEGAVTFKGQELSGKGGFLYKQDRAGNLIWIKQLNQAIIDVPIGRKIAVSASGDIYMTGTYFDQGMQVDSHSLAPVDSTNRVFVLRMNTDGAVQYLKSLPTSSSSGGIAVDSKDRAYVTTDVEPGDSINIIPIFKLDENGEELWSTYCKAYYLAIPTVNSNDELIVATDDVGNYTLFASTDGTVERIDMAVEKEMTGLAKYDEQGNVTWAKVLGVDPESAEYGGGWPTAVRCDEDDNIILNTTNFDRLARPQFDEITVPVNSEYFMDPWGYQLDVVKCNTDGEVQWVLPMLQKWFTYAYTEMDLDDEGNIYFSSFGTGDSVLFVTEYENSTILDGVDYAPENNPGLLVKVTKDGQWDWIRSMDTEGNLRLSGVEVMAEDEVWVYGYGNGKALTIDGQSFESATYHGFVASLFDCTNEQLTVAASEEMPCYSDQTVFTATGLLYASDYSWTVSPESAGTISGTGKEVSMNWSEDFAGDATIEVTGQGECAGFSSATTVTVKNVPAVDFSIQWNEESACPEEDMSFGTAFENGVTYEWAVSPETAGILSGEGHEVSVKWEEAFTGEATITLLVTADCGTIEEAVAVNVESCVLSAEDALSNSLEMYPNPAADVTEVRMNLSSQTDVSIRLVDMSGRTVYEAAQTAQAGAFRSELNTSTLEAGMYILQVKTNEGIATKQLLIK